MAKTKEELKALKEDVQTLNKKLSELSEDELKQVVGGISSDDPFPVSSLPEPTYYIERHNNGELFDELKPESDCEHGTLRFDSDLF